MPLWLSIVLGVLGGTGLTGILVKYILEKHKRQIDKANQYDQEQQDARIRNIFREEFSLMKNTLLQVEKKLDLNSAGTITLLRDRMKCSLNYCRKQGYKTSTDMANWMELYNSYKDLGGNHFREYVNQWKEEMESLPLGEDNKKGE